MERFFWKTKKYHQGLMYLPTHPKRVRFTSAHVYSKRQTQNSINTQIQN